MSITAEEKMSAAKRISRAAERLQHSIEGNAGRVLLIYTVVFAPLTFFLALVKVYWFDEFITLYISRTHSFERIWWALRIGVDQNPPLIHLLAAATTRIFGESAVALRAPSMVSFWVATLACYAFLRRHVPALFAAGAVIYLFATRAYDYGFDARPYGLLMACGMIALLAWQGVVQGRRRGLALVLLTVALAAGVSSHYYGVLLWFPIAAGEIVSTVQRRKLDFAVWIALAVAAVPLFFYLPLIRADLRIYSANAWNRPTLGFLWTGYESLLEETIYPAIALLCVAVVFWWRERRKSGQRLMSRPELAAVVTLAALPALALVLAYAKTGQVSARYVLPAAFGCAMLVAIAVAKVAKKRASAALVLLAVAFCWAAVRTSLVAQELLERRAQFQEFVAKPVLQGDLPIVVPDSMAILPLNYYGAFDRRLVFPIEFETVRNYQREDSAEQTLNAGRDIFPVRIEDFENFRREHSSFLILANEQNWLVRKLRDDGVALQEVIEKDEFYQGQVDPLFRARPQLWRVGLK